MHTPIHALRQTASVEARRARERWNSPAGETTHTRVVELIGDRAGEDFLQADFEAGRLPVLEDMWDLRGIYFGNKQWTFPPSDTFEAIDFSFGTFQKVAFTKAYFQATLRFARVENCRFINCSFQFTFFYCSELRNVTFERCDFLDSNDFVNCEMYGVSFRDCYYAANLFADCSFDRQCEVTPSTPKPLNVASIGEKSGTSHLVELYRAIKDAYSSGGAYDRSREYFFRQMEAARQHATPRLRDQILAFIFKWLAGYGVRPMRVLAAIAILYAIATAVFRFQFDTQTALLLAAGALFTFGAEADKLASVAWPFSVVYAITSFGGIALAALFVTVLATVFLRER